MERIFIFLDYFKMSKNKLFTKLILNSRRKSMILYFHSYCLWSAYWVEVKYECQKIGESIFEKRRDGNLRSNT